jgi:hypothetical protein
MIEWFDPALKVPDDGQECLIMQHRGGMATEAVFGPIAWNASMSAWFDLFRTSEAGTIIAAKDVGAWTAWEPIAPPDHLPTPWAEDQEAKT